MNRRLWVVLFLVFAAYIRAQPPTTTTYVGTVKDLTGATVTSGRITWQLNAPQGGVIPGTGSFVSTTVSCSIDANGHPVSTTDGTSPCVITNNTALTPTGTSYTMCTQPQFVSPGSCIVTFAPGGTVDISTVVPVPTTGPFNYAGTPGPPGPMATPSGAHGQVQINQYGIFGVAPSLTYDFATDTLHTNNLNVSGTSNLTWPPSCSSGGVYSPAANGCVAPGTAANAAGANGEAQVNAGGSFSAIPGSAPLGSNGMQYQGDLKANNFIGASAVSTPAAIGYRQNAGAAGVPGTAIAHNRDQTTAMFATPQDFCVGSGTGPPFDDTDCFNKGIRWLAGSNMNSAKTLFVPWTPNGYYFGNTTAQFLYTLPYDFGDYHGSAGYASQASVSAYFTSGQLTSCAIQGGSGYAPNAQLPIQILDPQHLGSGAAAYVLTDASGTPASTCVIQLAGMNYPQMGTQAAVIPLGGDGAAGTCVLAAGAFTSCSVTAGGFGYNDGTYGNRLKVPLNMAGLTCSPTYPVLAPVVTGTSITGVNITTAGTGCTWSGGAGPVPIQFGASCGGTQCTLLPMETPRNLPLSVALLSGVQIVGIGNPVIRTDLSLFGGSPSFSNPIAFGDPWGDQAGGVRQDLPPGDLVTTISRSASPYISNITVNAQIGFAFPLLSGGTFDRVTCGTGLCYYIGNTQSYLVNVQNTWPDSIFRDNFFFGIAGFFVGGDWKTRAPDAFAGGNQGGTIMAHGPTLSGFDLLAYGNTGGINIDNATSRFQTGTVNPAWDQFFEQYFWKAQNSPATPLTDAAHLLSNMSTTCLTTQTFVTRATDANFGKAGFAVAPWANCYRGVNGALVSALSRYSYTNVSGMTNNTQISNTNLTFRMRGVRAWNAWRPLYMGNALKVEVADAQALVSNVTSDPYLPGGVTNAWVWLTSNWQIFQQGSITDVNTGVGTFGLRSQNWGIAPDNSLFSVSNLLTRNISGFADQYGKETISTNTLTTTAATSDTLLIPSLTFRGRCQISPTNASAATNMATTYISSKATAGQITVTHTATAGMIYDVACTIYN